MIDILLPPGQFSMTFSVICPQLCHWYTLLWVSAFDTGILLQIPYLCVQCNAELIVLTTITTLELPSRPSDDISSSLATGLLLQLDDMIMKISALNKYNYIVADNMINDIFE